jgi:AcrR family transcriptional regulator
VNAVLDTAFEIFMDGSERPTATEIARRAGVSTSSLFRYFSSIDDLRAQVAVRYLEEHREVLEPDLPAGAEYEQRVRLYVDLRIRAATTLGPMSRRLQGRAVDEPALIPIQRQFRAILANQVETHFDAELATTPPGRRADLIAVIDSMTSIEAFRILHETHGRSELQVRRSWRSALHAILPTS